MMVNSVGGSYQVTAANKGKDSKWLLLRLD